MIPGDRIETLHFFLASVFVVCFPSLVLRTVCVFVLPNQSLSFGFQIQPCSLLAERGEGAEKHGKHLSISAAFDEAFVT
ncbi:hypothetical protein BDV39DRAFT_178149 [Aspergillus sergii]|uniref:Uncharacterized protein n=1 Tax=Aspergillus sergii TaxID=1034303 RepID=A0A5N6WY82_9EURO|nr:hypothetical protein BDV39DRAFT_178149 [Aspergillus sergii]